MTMNLQVQASAFNSHAAGAALFPSLLQPMPLAREQAEPAPPKADHRLEVPLAELNFRHLQTADEIAGIVHLRKEIQLVAASGEDPTFLAREKKETRRALSRHSSAAAPSSGPFASFR
jgi:hypothetical protein